MALNCCSFVWKTIIEGYIHLTRSQTDTSADFPTDTNQGLCLQGFTRYGPHHLVFHSPLTNSEMKDKSKLLSP